jgi:hypothetical protein
MIAEAPDRTDLALLEQRLRRARARVASSSPGGPEFDAAMAGLEELEAEFAGLLRETRSRTSVSASVGAPMRSLAGS